MNGMRTRPAIILALAVAGMATPARAAAQAQAWDSLREALASDDWNERHWALQRINRIEGALPPELVTPIIGPLAREAALRPRPGGEDTLTLYVGDGNEVEESYNGLLYGDSVVQISVERSRLQRYMRRRAAGHAASGAAAGVSGLPPPEAWDRANSATVRLAPAAFPQLPAAVHADLEQRHCRIAQAYDDTAPANVVSGAFRRTGEMDWAVLCSRNDTSRILVYWGGAPESPDSLAAESDRSELQGGVGAGIGYSRALGVASPAYIRQHYEWYGGPTPPPLDHEGINDIFLEKASVVFYWYNGRWLRLTGAD
jgi:hypothetical protein